MRVGAQRTSEYLPLLVGKRVAVVTNQTGLIGTRHLVDSLLALDVQVAERQTTVALRSYDVKGEPREVSNALSELLQSLEYANAIRLRPRVTLVGRRLVVVVHGADVARLEEALKLVDP